MLTLIKFKKRNKKLDYNLITNFNKANTLQYSQLNSLSNDIFDDNYPIDVESTDDWMLMIQLNNKIDNIYLDNKLITPAQYLQTIISTLNEKELFYLSDIKLETKRNKPDKNILNKYLFNNDSLPDSYINKNNQPKYFYKIHQNTVVNDTTSYNNHRTIVTSNTLYTPQNLFHILINYHRESWADFDEKGLVKTKYPYKEQNKEKMIITQIDLKAARKLIKEAFEKNNYAKYSRIKLDVINLEFKNNTYHVSQLHDINTISNYDSFDKDKVSEYLNFLILSEIKNKNLTDKFKEHLIMQSL